MPARRERPAAPPIAALHGGYQLAFAAGAAFALLAAGLGALFLPMQSARPATPSESAGERADQAA